MKLIQATRALVVAPDPPARAEIVEGLKSLRLGEVIGVASLDEARSVLASRPLDVCVLAVEALPQPDAPAMPPLDLPTILLSHPMSRIQARAMVAAGYAAVLPWPVAPRLIYRRIGSVLQQARREDRRALIDHSGGPVALPMAAEARE